MFFACVLLVIPHDSDCCIADHPRARAVPKGRGSYQQLQAQARHGDRRCEEERGARGEGGGVARGGGGGGVVLYMTCSLSLHLIGSNRRVVKRTARIGFCIYCRVFAFKLEAGATC